MQHDFWVIVDGSRYAGRDVLKANRARRVFAILEAHIEHGAVTQFLVVGDDEKFHTVFANDCQFYAIEDDRGAYFDLT